MGARDAARQGAPVSAGTRSCRTARAAARRCRATRWRRATRTSRTRGSTWRSYPLRWDEPRPRASSSGPRRRGRWCRTPRSRCIRTSTYVEVRAQGPSALDRSRSAGRRVARRARRGGAARGADGRGAVHGRGARRAALPAAARLACRSPRASTRSSCRRTSSRPTTAPAWCTCRPRSAPTTTRRGSGTAWRSQPVDARGRFAGTTAGGRRHVREGRRRRRSSSDLKRARRALEGGHGRALVSALLALRHAAALLRAHVVVRAHDGGAATGCSRATRRSDWHPPEIGQRPLRRVAREQHRLGDLARPLLGHAAAGLGLRRTTPAHVEVIGELRRTRGALGRAAARGLRSAQAVHRRATRGRARAGAAARCAARREVIDAWFDSGSMPFAQWHYPFENEAEFARALPGGLHRRGRRPDARMVLLAARDRRGRCVLTTRRRAVTRHRRVVVNDLVLDANGQKMSKSTRQRGRAVAVIERARRRRGAALPRRVEPGLDAARFDESGDPRHGGRASCDAHEHVQRHLRRSTRISGGRRRAARPGAGGAARARPLGALAARDGGARGDARARTATTRPAPRALVDGFVDDDVSNWYVRLSRARFWDVGGTADNRAAFATLHEVLASRAACSRRSRRSSPTGCTASSTGESVHLAPYVRPRAPRARRARSSAAMTRVRTLATLGARGARGGRHQGAPAARAHAVRRPGRAWTARRSTRWCRCWRPNSM